MFHRIFLSFAVVISFLTLGAGISSAFDCDGSLDRASEERLEWARQYARQAKEAVTPLYAAWFINSQGTFAQLRESARLDALLPKEIRSNKARYGGLSDADLAQVKIERIKAWNEFQAAEPAMDEEQGMMLDGLTSDLTNIANVMPDWTDEQRVQDVISDIEKASEILRVSRYYQEALSLASSEGFLAWDGKKNLLDLSQRYHLEGSVFIGNLEFVSARKNICSSYARLMRECKNNPSSARKTDALTDDILLMAEKGRLDADRAIEKLRLCVKSGNCSMESDDIADIGVQRPERTILGH